MAIKKAAASKRRCDFHGGIDNCRSDTMSSVQPATGSNRELICISTEKLEYFPNSQPSGGRTVEDEGEWLEEMTEKAERSE